MTTTMSDLPSDLAVEILSRVPVTSRRKVRSTCKTWYTLSKYRSFTNNHLAQTKAAAARESVAVVLMGYGVYLMSFNLNGSDPSVQRRGKLISPVDSGRVDMSRVYQCDGLLLCITKNFKRFLVCNPYLGQYRWIKPTRFHPRMHWYTFALGYDKSKSSCNYKVLRFCYYVNDVDYQIYELNSNSWRVLDVTDTEIIFSTHGISLGGNTYWSAHGSYQAEDANFCYFLVCFDFTTERFGPRLGLPFHATEYDTVTLSCVGEEQLAVLFEQSDTLQVEIWVTSKIEPGLVSWSKIFLSVDMNPLKCYQFSGESASFFVDVEKKVAVVFDKDEEKDPTRNMAYIFGENGYFRIVDLEKYSYKLSYPLMCSYVPSIVQIK